MFRIYFMNALRFLIRNKLFSVINILGLALGLAAGIYILMFILNEFSFDRFNRNLDDIYRVTWRFDQSDVSEESSITTAAVGPSILEEFPEAGQMTRFVAPVPGNLDRNGKNYYARSLSYVDSSFFRIFSYPLKQGDPENILMNPFEIVLSESLAGRIFGTEDPVGQVLRLDHENSFVVKGVFRDVPVNSHLDFDALISFSTLYRYPNVYLDWDGGHNYYTYVMLAPGTDPEQLALRFPEFMEKHLNYKYRDFGMNVSLFLQPLKDVHLRSTFNDDVETRGSMASIYILSSIALLILLMACVNFINLSTARALKRAREIGIRKVMGASRSMLVWQFLLESSLYILIAFILSLVLVDVFQPWFNQLIGKEFSFFSVSNSMLFTVIPLLLVIMTLIAGGYPAYKLSRYLPVVVMKGTGGQGLGRTWSRNGLVVFQFFITAVLIAAGLVIYHQLDYIKRKSSGYQKDGIVIVSLNERSFKNKHIALREAFLSIPGVLSVGASSEIPGFDFTRNGYFPEGLQEPVMVNVLDIDPFFLQTMGITLSQGRNFLPGMASDSNAYLVNQSFAKKMNWEAPVGKWIARDGKHPVIGVVDDFHFASLHKEIAPLILTMNPWEGYNYLCVKTDTRDLPALISRMEKSWKTLANDEPFDYFFLSDHLRLAYREEENFGKMLGYFGLVAIVIASLGLLGLSSYLTEQRRREIGIRKVLGASASRILSGYAGGFLKLVLLANIIAVPVIWYAMPKWLERFAYRIDLDWTIFPVAFLVSSLIALLTISVQIYSASHSNPVDSLKAE